ncbi:L-dopachrome tautomerase-related protein [Paraglaciecola agarilytica]|uniref:L-dopachrome tautomerase-related protein n=1 Tax=Paraglaciecola chathamensis TaxID=368405 RepID=UPI00235287DC|nr:L-dopachrome tautomerase-related protein [Paraglaciecola agarilytica]|tara:strand:- start:22370 stop:23566 length:1197 start_codon:yes stop_codon:yes gene_type:complete
MNLTTRFTHTILPNSKNVRLLSFLVAGALTLSSAANAEAETVAPETMAKTEVYAEVDGAVGGITYTQNKRFIFSYHPFFNPKVKVAELLENGQTIAFPNEEMQRAYTTDGQLKSSAEYLNWVLGVRADGRGKVWLLDSGQAEPRTTPKLVAWDVVNDKLSKIIYLPESISIAESQLNDLAISHKYQRIVIADEGIGQGSNGDKAALVVVNTVTGASRRILQGTESVLPDYSLPIISDEGLPSQKQIDAFIGADGIVLDNKEQWLYFAPLNKKYVYRIAMADIANDALSDKQLAKRVQRYAEKPNNGGLSIDADDNLYLTIVGGRKVGVIPADTREYRDYAEDKDMIWPDGVSIGPDGYLYTGAAQLPLSAAFNDGVASNKVPYLIYRFKPIAEGVTGR